MFTSLLDAYDELYRTAQHISACFKISDSSPTEPAITSPYLHLLDHWYIRFLAFVRSPASRCHCHCPHNETHHLLGAAHIEIEYLIAFANLWTALAPEHRKATALHDEVVFNTYPRILTLSEQIMRTLRASSEGTSGNEIHAVRECIGFQTSHTKGCWTVATGCRDPALRRKAVAILRAWHTRDKADTLVCADLAEGIVNFEESLALQIHHRNITDLYQIQGEASSNNHQSKRAIECASDIPEEARCWFLTDAPFGETIEEGLSTLPQNNGSAYKAMKFLVIRRIRESNDSDIAPHIPCRIVTVKETVYIERSSRRVLHHTRHSMYPSESSTGTNAKTIFPQHASSPAQIFQEIQFQIAHPPCDRLSPLEEAPWRLRRGETPQTTAGQPTAAVVSTSDLSVTVFIHDGVPAQPLKSSGRL